VLSYLWQIFLFLIANDARVFRRPMFLSVPVTISICCPSQYLKGDERRVRFCERGFAWGRILFATILQIPSSNLTLSSSFLDMAFLLLNDFSKLCQNLFRIVRYAKNRFLKHILNPAFDDSKIGNHINRKTKKGECCFSALIELRASLSLFL
jgi:hypothetical protein